MSRPPRSQPPPVRTSAAFTLVELLVASALFLILLLVILSITTHTLSVTSRAKGLAESGGGLRQVMNRMTADMTAAVARKDLPPLFLKQPRNDAFYFYSATDGYEGQRGISFVGYRVREGGVERGAQGTGWSTNQVAFSTVPPSADTLEEINYDRLGERVFRMELEFLAGDGTIHAGPPAPTQWTEIKAVIVNLATVDQAAFQKATGSFDALAALLPDATAGDSIQSVWGALLRDPAFYTGDAEFPAAVRQGIRLQQRVIPVRR